MSKEPIDVRVDSEIWNEFRNYVKERYGTLYGHLGRETNRALEQYLNKVSLSEKEKQSMAGKIKKFFNL